jgi:hypothetical protein
MEKERPDGPYFADQKRYRITPDVEDANQTDNTDGRDNVSGVDNSAAERSHNRSDKDGDDVSETECLTSEYNEIISACSNLAECLYKAECFQAECFLNYPKFDEQGRHPFHFETIRQYQNDSEQVQNWLRDKPNDFVRHTFGETELICKVKDGSYRMAISDEMLPKLVKWYHLHTMHAEGMDRLEASIKRHYYHPKIRDEVRKQVGSCVECNTNKKFSGQFGEHAPREAPLVPWEEIHVDCIGPWETKKKWK